MNIEGKEKHCVQACSYCDLTLDECRQIAITLQEITVVVRCKNCKYHDEEDGKNFCDCGNRPDDWFCADGVRRE